MVEPFPPLTPRAVTYFEARERRLAIALRVSEVLNSLVRPVLAVVFGAATVWLAIVGTITSGEFLTVSAVVILYFFKARDDERTQERFAAQNTEMLDLAKQLPPPAHDAAPHP